LPWFRFRRRKDDPTAQADSTQEAPPLQAEHEPHEPPPLAVAEDDTPSVDGGTAAKRRRRGSRGGRNRRKPAGASVAENGPPVENEAADTEPSREATDKQKSGSDRDRSSKRGGQRSTGRERRRQIQRRQPLPEAKRELLITVDVGEQRVALLEDDRVAEVYLERPERRSIAGNIYLGTVDNVLPGMEAAFVEIGLEKNGFLYVDEIVVPELEGTRHGKKITDLIQRGQEILVQAVKDPMKTKGARLTTEISLPGRFLVYVPNGEGLGVSRRLEDAERQRLKDILKEIAPPSGGVIVRTAAEGASAEDVERDLVFLQRLWKTIQAHAKIAKAPELVYQEAELPLRIVRDLFAGDFSAAHVDSDRTYKRIVGYLKKTSPHMVDRVHRTKEKEPLFERYGVEKEIASTLDRRVDLPSGGYLIFDYAEAFTVIDVNTGRFVGSRSKTSTQRLEDTAVKNNLEAVKEVVRQLRLRDIGGIIVIDFIDMANPKNRQAVEETLRAELERDRTKTYVVEISPLGLVEMTRQNVTDGPREIMTRRCPTCAGDGIVVSDATIALEVERKLRTLAAAGAGSRIQAYQVAVHPKTLALLGGPGGARLEALEEATRRRFYLVPATGHAHADHFEVLAEGRRDDLAPPAPVAEGAELEVKLVELDLHDSTSAVGKLDGLEVVVADAAKLVGKKAKVVVGRVLDGRALATLVRDQVTPVPITFESEAEKPTRSPARKKDEVVDTVVTEVVPLDESVDETPVDETGDVAETGDDAEALDPEASDDGATPKKRTRRGSRGGRRRKKPTQGEGVAEADLEADEETFDEEPSESADPVPMARRRAPKIHVPGDPRTDAEPVGEASLEPVVEEPEQPVAEEASEGVDGEQSVPKKRTRRGSRGGRNRKKKPVAADASANGQGTVATDGGEPSVSSGGEPSVSSGGKPSVSSGSAPSVSSGEPPVPSGDGRAEPEPEPEPEAAVAEPEPEPATVARPEEDGEGYVPMSEWIEDFDRRP